jgi:thiamine biosynthesis protein ThiS
MLALASVWFGLATLVLAGAMLLYRPAFTDVTVALVLYFGSPGALCFAGLVLWAHRKDRSLDAGLAGQRLQAKVAVALALLAAAVVYLLIIRSEKLDPIERQASAVYNPRPGRTMQITVNGSLEDFDDEMSVAQLLARRKIEPIRVAVEINEDIIPRRTFAGHTIHDGDRIEIVTFVGGG